MLAQDGGMHPCEDMMQSVRLLNCFYELGLYELSIRTLLEQTGKAE